jgi:hypothetical protein
MASPAWELQKAIYGVLAADTMLIALLGAARVYDEVPRGAPFPFSKPSAERCTKRRSRLKGNGS